MTITAIAPELRRFILTSIPSVPHLEALLLLRNAPATLWTSALLAERLYLGEKSAAVLLVELAGVGIAAAESAGYRYQPRSGELRDRIDQLALAYSNQLLEVTHLIHSKMDRKAHQFSEAFKLRKDS
jgi:hypothetical protein